jgi:hypothetical protein
MNRTEFAKLKFGYNFHFLPFPVEGVLMIASPIGKKSKVYMRSKVKSFDGYLFLWLGALCPVDASKNLTLLLLKVHEDTAVWAPLLS